MSIVVCLTLLLAWTSQCATLSLTASTNTLSRSGTSNFTLTCTIDDHGNNSTSDGGLEEIYRMRIVKRGNNRWNTVVEMSPEWKDPKVADDSEGQLTAKSGHTYLQATWAMTTYDDIGRYICDVLGYSWNGESVRQRTPSVYIDSEVPLSLFELFTMTQKALRSINENRDGIQTMTSTHEMVQRKLETSLKTNQKVLSDVMENKNLIQKMTSTQKIFQQKLEASNKTNIKVLSDIMENNDLFQKLNSTHEIFQRHIEASNKINKEVLSDIMENKDLIQKINSTNEMFQRYMEASNKTNMKVLSEVMNNEQRIAILKSTHEIHQKHLDKANITMKFLLQDMSMLKQEISNNTNEKALKDDFTRNKELIMKMKSSQKKINNKLENLIQLHSNFWPQGSYALIEPETGCPANAGVQWKRGYRKHSSSTYRTFSDNISKVSTSAHMKKPVLQRKNADTVYVTQHYCSVVEPSPGIAWPAGSYCIMKYRNLSCPVGFQEGSIFYQVDDSGPPSVRGYHAVIVKNYNSITGYCCRKDNPHNETIHLPTTKPFYLHRYRGTCQQVKDMQVTEEYIYVDTDYKGSKFVAYAPDGYQFLPQVKLVLCYYVPI